MAKRKHKYTHLGKKQGYDARTNDKITIVRLRETKKFWIDISGTRYHKRSPWTTTGDWPLYSLTEEPRALPVDDVIYI